MIANLTGLDELDLFDAQPISIVRVKFHHESIVVAASQELPLFPVVGI